jgi:serine/threonine-protein phosphatase 2A regulatory subunit B
VKLWKISERERKLADGSYNLRYDDGTRRVTNSGVALHLPKLVPMELIVEASPRRVYANAHTYVSQQGKNHFDRSVFMLIFAAHQFHQHQFRPGNIHFG